MDRQEYRERRTSADDRADLAGAHAEREAIERHQEDVEIDITHAEQPDHIARDRVLQDGPGLPCHRLIACLVIRTFPWRIGDHLEPCYRRGPMTPTSGKSTRVKRLRSPKG